MEAKRAGSEQNFSVVVDVVSTEQCTTGKDLTWLSSS